MLPLPRREMASRPRPATDEDPREYAVVQRAKMAAAGVVKHVSASDQPRLSPPQVGIGDDAAVLPDGTVVTTDTMVEGVHWDNRLAPADVGYKLVAVNVSDLDAMGARPAWATLALSLPATVELAWVDEFFSGLEAALARWPFHLVGGDTTRAAGGTVATLTLAGRATRPVLRSGGQAGNELWVSGTLGLTACAFSHAPTTAALAHLRRPNIAAPLGAILAENNLVTAMIDLSDGLARDLARLCRASACGAAVHPGLLPTDRALHEAVAFGEDYGLLFAAPEHHRGAIQSRAAALGIPVTPIGTLTANLDLLLLGHDTWPAAGFDHFSGSAP